MESEPTVGSSHDDTGNQYQRISYWLRSADQLEARPPLTRSIDVDVAILGAGFSGLWTAYALLKRRPDLRIAIAEQQISGFGASGRNQGTVAPGLGAGLRTAVARYGRDRARSVWLEMVKAIDRIEMTMAEEAIQADYSRNGLLMVARGARQLQALAESFQLVEAMGLASYHEWLSQHQVQERVSITGTQAGVFAPVSGSVNPGKLVRQLATAVERLGATIYEKSPVSDIRLGTGPALITPGGAIRSKTVVLAGEAYLAQSRWMRRRILPIYSYVVMTDPLSSDALASLKWHTREVLGSMRVTVEYLSITSDNRIVLGGRGAPYHFASSVDDRFDRYEPTFARLQESLFEWFPQLQGKVSIADCWGGPLGVSREWLPVVHYDSSQGLGYVTGYVGQGVVPSRLAGEALADLILDLPSSTRALPFISDAPPRWPLEPFRWLGARAIHAGLLRADSSNSERHSISERLLNALMTPSRRQ